jgi:hypothetical protein
VKIGDLEIHLVSDGLARRCGRPVRPRATRLYQKTFPAGRQHHPDVLDLSRGTVRGRTILIDTGLGDKPPKKPSSAGSSNAQGGLWRSCGLGSRRKTSIS